MKIQRIFWHVFLPCVLTALTALVIADAFAVQAFKKALYGHTQQELRSVADMATSALAVGTGSDRADYVNAMCRAMGESSGYRITVVTESGRVTGDSEEDYAKMDNHGSRPEVLQALRGDYGVAVRFSQTLRKDMMYVTAPIVTGDRITGAVRVSLPLRGLDEVQADMRKRILQVSAIVGFLALAVSLVFARRITGPLRELRGGCEALGRGQTAHFRRSYGMTEIDVLADALNRTSEQARSEMSVVTRQRDEEKALLSCMTEGVLAVDHDQRVIRMNQAAASLFHVEADRCIGHDLMEAVRNADLLDVVERTFAGPEIVEGEIFLPDQELFLQAHGTSLRGSDGRNMGAVIVLTDITRIRKLETIRRDFVANVSHELKTPVTSIKGFAETLLDGPPADPAEQKRFLEIIARQAERLHRIIDDLLMLSGIEHGTERKEIELIPGAAGQAIDAAVENFRKAAAEKGIVLDKSCLPGLTVKMNLQLLEEAIGNLIDNAIKYSEAGTRVEVGASATDSEITLYVRDEGPGIAERHLSRLFERFYRVDKGRSRKLGGTGLGLAIVKHVAIAHGGRADVESKAGCGSTFTIILPRIHKI